MDQEINNRKIHLRHITIFIMALLNLWELRDIAGVANAYGNLIGFLAVITPLSGILFFVSLFAKDKDEGWLKKISVAGMAIGAITFSVSGLLTAYRLILYY